MCLSPFRRVMRGACVIAWLFLGVVIESAETPGALDLSFAPGTHPDVGEITELELDGAGRIVVAGGFPSWSAGPLRRRIARLGADGSLDATFHGPTNFAAILALAVQPDDKVVVFASTGGRFIGGISHIDLVLTRLNSDGTQDLSFNTVSNFVDSTFNGPPRASLCFQSGGRIVLSGTASGLRRFDTNGVRDPAFMPTIVTDHTLGWRLFSLASLPDDKLLLGGNFVGVDNVRSERVARLNADGSADASFSVASMTGTDQPVHVFVVAPYPDGKVFISGRFSQVNGVQRNLIARLNSDGSLDGFFNPQPGLEGVLRSPFDVVGDAEVDAHGRVVIGGEFIRVSGIARERIARLEADGSVDLTFAPTEGLGPSGLVTALRIQPDGKILIGGFFNAVGGVARPGVARLYGADPAILMAPSITRHPSNLIARAGQRIELAVIAKASPPAQYQWEFNGEPLVGATNTFLVRDSVLAEHAGFYRVRVANSLGSVTSDVATLTVRAETFPGAVDPSFNPGAGLQKVPTEWINALGIQSTGRIIVGGRFTVMDSRIRNNIAALGSDGALDPQRLAGNGLQGSPALGDVLTLGVQADDKIIAGGIFTRAEQITQPYLARYTAEGALDTTFGARPDGPVEALAIQPDGRVVVAGQFRLINDVARGFLARLETGGQVDISFVPPAITSFKASPIRAVAVQPDGKIIIAGNFSLVDGLPRRMLARVQADGRLDASFTPDWDATNEVLSLEVLRDGGILVAGTFTTTTVPPRATVARLKPDGSLDMTFHFDAGPISAGYPVVYKTLEQPDGKIIVGGFFTFVHGVFQPHLARIEANGQWDPTFKPELWRSANVIKTMAWQKDKLLIAGSIHEVNGIPRRGIARLYLSGENRNPSLLHPRVSQGIFSALLPWTDPGRTYVVERSDQLATPRWTVIARIAGDGTVKQVSDPAAGSVQFYRLRIE